MANRYWVGGGGNWSDSANHWSVSSGGSPGASTPGSTDDMYFDVSSSTASYTVIADSWISGRSMYWSLPGAGVPHWAGNGRFDLGGSFQLVDGMILSWSGGFYNYSGAGAWTFDTKGILASTNTLTWQTAAESEFTLLSNWNAQNNLIFFNNASNINLNGYSLSAAGISFAGGSNKLNAGTGTITIFSNHPSVCFDIGTVSSMSANQLTVKFIYNGGGLVRFVGGSQKYFKVINSTSGAAKFSITGSNSFETLQSDPGRVIEFGDGEIQTVTAIPSGTLGNLITLTSTSGATWYITKQSGIVSGDYLKIGYSTVSGSAVFYAGNNSTNDGNNSGWIFTSPSRFKTQLVGYGGNFTALLTRNS